MPSPTLSPKKPAQDTQPKKKATAPKKNPTPSAKASSSQLPPLISPSWPDRPSLQLYSTTELLNE
eukprot:1982324-Alexandrium_andersonii.AAC.1